MTLYLVASTSLGIMDDGLVPEQQEMARADQPVASVVSGAAEYEHLSSAALWEGLGDGVRAREAGQLHQLVHRESVLVEQLLVEGDRLRLVEELDAAAVIPLRGHSRGAAGHKTP